MPIETCSATTMTDVSSMCFAAVNTTVVMKRPSISTLLQTMQSKVESAVYDLEIFDSVVVLDSIDVVNMLRCRDRSAQMLFHDVSMFEDTTTAVSRWVSFDHNVDIPSLCLLPATFITVMAKFLLAITRGTRRATESAFGISKGVHEQVAAVFTCSSGNLAGHRSQSLRCRAGGVPSTARLHCVSETILPP